VRRVIDYLAADPAADASTATLAAVAGVSTRHLTRLFMDDLGVSPGRYVRRSRTDSAAHLVATTTLPLSGVARRCGFGSVEAMRLAFVERFGLAPSRYRSLHAPTVVADTAPARGQHEPGNGEAAARSGVT
jgi:transcriptional regulator GlxA family with amidase domain